MPSPCAAHCSSSHAPAASVTEEEADLNADEQWMGRNARHVQTNYPRLVGLRDHRIVKYCRSGRKNQFS